MVSIQIAYFLSNCKNTVLKRKQSSCQVKTLDSFPLSVYNAHVDIEGNGIGRMAANDFNDRIRFGSLYEMYGALLTEKQQQCLELYFCEDYSLAEVAEEMKVSRQAIHDLLKRVEQTLERYESMLGFLQRAEKTRALTEEADTILREAISETSNDLSNEENSNAKDDSIARGSSLKGLNRVREILNELKDTQVN